MRITLASGAPRNARKYQTASSGQRRGIGKQLQLDIHIRIHPSSPRIRRQPHAPRRTCRQRHVDARLHLLLPFADRPPS